MIFIFDGSFNGLLTTIFEFFERRPKQFTIVSKALFQPLLMYDFLEVITQEEKSMRVWKGLEKRVSSMFLYQIYTAYLSEKEESFQHIFEFCVYVFNSKTEKVEQNFGHKNVIGITKIAKSVSRERHRMKAFIRFQETSDGIFYAGVEPDFNVLPLIAKFFKDRFADQQWIIYDLKRKYGLFYNLKTVEEVVFEMHPDLKKHTTDENHLAVKEDLFSILWQDYFKSTNILARKNMKLHIRHVPKRYWKYLTEKRVAP
ncbi:DUF4130 domain-containing protein [Flavobacterium sp. NST-5]|uniref:DUF4130 domain-containing protein n=1 Tax=Flavobacterium ichthyis TaxID=2698827 RepID=A0ABW9Z6C1_9FLAO|nr:TIGR03915 family putative DNA repair protein [Flavobacterium ichthyis]NBL64117.1 DUF4130 domain-containing protein [Flavobacterium ichthyis]